MLSEVDCKRLWWHGQGELDRWRDIIAIGGSYCSWSHSHSSSFFLFKIIYKSDFLGFCFFSQTMNYSLDQFEQLHLARNMIFLELFSFLKTMNYSLYTGSCQEVPDSQRRVPFTNLENHVMSLVALWPLLLDQEWQQLVPMTSLAAMSNDSGIAASASYK